MNKRDGDMRPRTYHIRTVLVLLALLTVGGMIPVSGDNEYLDGGFLGVPADIYYQIDPSVTNNIIGTVHDETLFGLSEDRPLHFGHRFYKDFEGDRPHTFRTSLEPRIMPPHSPF